MEASDKLSQYTTEVQLSVYVNINFRTEEMPYRPLLTEEKFGRLQIKNGCCDKKNETTTN
jgi:hypothetical protein